MPTYDTTPAQLGALIRRHETMRRDGVTGAVRASANLGAKLLRAAAPRATRALRDSIHVEYDGPNTYVIFDAPHAIYVEFGCRPHMPPVPPLIRWAQAIGANDPRDMAWAVAIKIKNEGIRPTYFVRRTLPAMIQATGASVQVAVRKV